MIGFWWGLAVGILLTIYCEGVAVSYAAHTATGIPPWVAFGFALRWPWDALRR